MVKTDHRPLVYLFSMKDPASKLTRIRLDLEEYNFDVVHVSGKENVGPDALSRIEIDSEQLKSLSILPVQTRSMSKKRTPELDKLQIHKANETDHLCAYDSVNNLDAFSLPKLTFESINNIINVRIMNKNMKNDFALAQFHYNDIDANMLKTIIETVDTMAKNLNIRKIAIANNNLIFQLVNKQIFKEICNTTLKNTKIVLYTTAQVITDTEIINNLIKEYHDSPTGGHVGTSRLYKRLRSNYYWNDMLNTIRFYVKNCSKCTQNKHLKHTKEILIKTETPMKCFDSISIDTVGPFTKSQHGNRYAITIQCELSKFVVIEPMPDKQAKTLAKAFVEKFILVHGCPLQIKTDLGTEYKNEIFEEINKMLSIDHKFSTAYHHETVGSLERNHKVLNEFLRSFVNADHDDWDQWIPYYCFCYNTSPHSDHQYTPFELVFGRQPNYPSSLKNIDRIDPVYNIENYHNELKFKLQTAAFKARELLDIAKQKRISTTSSSPINVTIGDTVYLQKENRRKLDQVYTGPFKIISINHPNVTIEDNLKNHQTVHKNRIMKRTTV